MKWIVEVKGDPHKTSCPADWEISVVREDNEHGLKSWGWFDENKLLISHSGGPCKWPLPPGFGKLMIRIAEDYARHLNLGFDFEYSGSRMLQEGETP